MNEILQNLGTGVYLFGIVVGIVAGFGIGIAVSFIAIAAAFHILEWFEKK